MSRVSKLTPKRAAVLRRIILSRPPTGAMKLPRPQTMALLKRYVTAWTELTTRNQDMSDSRIKEFTLGDLRKVLKYYLSVGAREQAEE